MIKLNSKGFDVIDLQAKLRFLGVYKGLITGLADERTIEAVKSYQNKNGLSADGIAGPVTLASIDSKAGDAWLYLFIHCTASPEGRNFIGDDVFQQDLEVAEHAVHRVSVEQIGVELEFGVQSLPGKLDDQAQVVQRYVILHLQDVDAQALQLWRSCWIILEGERCLAQRSMAQAPFGL